MTILTAFVQTIGNVFKHGLHFEDYNYRETVNAFKIDLGMFQGNFGQVFRKLTWGLPNTLMGNLMAHGYNIAGKVNRVTLLEGAIALDGPMGDDYVAFSMGGYLFGPNEFKADWRDHLFVHEYGHFLQGLTWGPFFLPVIALPSLASAGGVATGGVKHDKRWFEVDASRRGMKYFDTEYGLWKRRSGQSKDQFFDKESFSEGSPSTYINPRIGRFNGYKDRSPVTGAQFSPLGDVGIPLLSFLFVVFLIWTRNRS